MPSHFSSVRKPAGSLTGSGTVLGKKKSTSGDSKIKEFGVKQSASIFSWKLHCRCPIIGLLESRTSATFAHYSVHSSQSSYLLYVRPTAIDQRSKFSFPCHHLSPFTFTSLYCFAILAVGKGKYVHWSGQSNSLIQAILGVDTGRH